MKRLIPMVAILTACSDVDPADTPGFVLQDSSGVEVALNRIDADQVPALPVQEDLRIGSVDGSPETQFSTIRRLVAGPGDEIHALLRENEIRVFDPDGRFIRTVGRAGEGPGEFQGLVNLFVLSDTLVALDTRLGRATVMTAAGDVIATSPLVRTEAGPITPVGAAPDGWLFDVPQPWEWPEHGRFIQRLSRIMLASGTRDLGVALGRAQQSPDELSQALELTQGRMFGMDQGGVMTGQRPLWERTFQSWALDRTGRLYRAAREEYRIDVFDHTGALRRQIRRTHQPVAIQEDWKRRFLQEAITHHDTVQVRTEFGTDPVDTYRFRIDIPTPAALPALGTLLVSAEGVVMVERPDLVADPVAMEWTDLGPQSSHWDLFDVDGSFLGTVTLPPRFTPHVVSRSHVLGVIRDELGVEYIVRYRVGS